MPNEQTTLTTRRTRAFEAKIRLHDDSLVNPDSIIWSWSPFVLTAVTGGRFAYVTAQGEPGRQGSLTAIATYNGQTFQQLIIIIIV